MIFLLLWLTSLSITISRPIHVDANGIISLFFNGWVISHCIYVPHLLYQFLCWWTINDFSYAEIFSLYTHFHSVLFSSSVVSNSVTAWTTECQASLSITNFWSLLKFMSIESVMTSNHLILCHSLLLPPSIFSSIRAFSNESALCIRWPKYWSFSFNISPSNEHPGLIPLRMNSLDLLAVQGMLESSPTP